MIVRKPVGIAAPSIMVFTMPSAGLTVTVAPAATRVTLPMRDHDVVMLDLERR